MDSFWCLAFFPAGCVHFVRPDSVRLFYRAWLGWLLPGSQPWRTRYVVLHRLSLHIRGRARDLELERPQGFKDNGRGRGMILIDA